MTHPNILISSAGRRVGLMNCVRQSIESRGAARRLFSIDAAATAPAAFLADGHERVPRCTDPGFIDAVLRVCAANDIGLIVPTIDTELPVYAAAAGAMADRGVMVCISQPSTIRICCDKVATHEWLVSKGFPTVRQTDVVTALNNRAAWPLPLVGKPYNGSASVGVRHIRSERELSIAAEHPSGYLVQETATGREFTINVYVSRGGECIAAVPHWRMEVRSGEVSKAITVREARLVELARDVASALPGAYGPLNIQCFMDDSGRIQIIEINARFGGGYPLAHRAGARFTDWLLDELEGARLPTFDDWTADLAMLRFDDAVFVPGERIRV